MLLLTINVDILGQKLRPNFICCLDIWWNRDGLKCPNHKSPTLLAPMVESGSPGQTALLKRTRHSSFLSLSSGFHFPASSWNYAKKSIALSHSNQGLPQPLATTRPYSYSPGCWLCSEFSAHLAFCGMQCPTLSCKCMWLINCCQSHMSSVGCQMLYVASL